MDLKGWQIYRLVRNLLHRSVYSNVLWAKASFLEDSGKVQFSRDWEQSGAKPVKVLARSRSISVMLTHAEWNHLHALDEAANLDNHQKKTRRGMLPMQPGPIREQKMLHLLTQNQLLSRSLFNLINSRETGK